MHGDELCNSRQVSTTRQTRKIIRSVTHPNFNYANGVKSNDIATIFVRTIRVRSIWQHILVGQFRKCSTLQRFYHDKFLVG